MFKVNEIFYTIQGEGPTSGKPSIFIRLAGCNLRCVWCDTKYTWLYHKNTLTKILEVVPQEKHHLAGEQVYDKESEIFSMDQEEILTKISEYPGKNIVITGGEPLLQKEKLIPLTQALISSGYSIEIETNGTISPVGFDAVIRFNVSPKLSNSYNPRDRRLNFEVLDEFKEAISIFKFVVSGSDDIGEIQEIIDKVAIPSEKVYLMPEGQTSGEIREKSKQIIKLCKQRDFNYTHRLHIELFDAKRGV